MDALTTDVGDTPAPPPSVDAAATDGHRPLDERIAIGEAQAKNLPLEQIGDPPSRDGRPDILEVLRNEAKGRLSELLPLRHARMAGNPFATLRGTAAIMAADLASRPSTNLIVQLCGDAHLVNFGMYGSPERTLVFDVNDFDETHPDPLPNSLMSTGTETGKGSHSRRVDCCTCRIDRSAECAQAVAIGRRELDQCRVETHLTAREDAWDVGQEDGNEIGQTVVDHPPQTRAGEQRHGTQVAHLSGSGKRHRPFQVEMPKPNVLQVGAP